MTDRYNIKEILFPDTPFDLPTSTVLLMRRGSEAHNLYIPPSSPESIDDRDVMGICIPPLKYYIGLKEWRHAESIKECWDVVLYEFRKFVDMLVKQNPNVVSMLWLRKEDYLYIHPVGQMLLDNKNLFRCRKAAFDSHMGYANSQLKRMTHMEHFGYMGAKRKQLVEKYGYDTKNAAHLIRLLHMGEEYMRTGELQPCRTTDREMLLDIKTGKWSLDKVHAYANECFDKCRKSYETGSLPEKIDYEAVDALVVECMRQFHKLIRGYSPLLTPK